MAGSLWSATFPFAFAGFPSQKGLHRNTKRRRERPVIAVAFFSAEVRGLEKRENENVKESFREGKRRSRFANEQKATRAPLNFPRAGFLYLMMLASREGTPPTIMDRGMLVAYVLLAP